MVDRRRQPTPQGHDFDEPPSDTGSLIESAEVYSPVFSETISYDVLRALGASRAYQALRALADDRAAPA
jgi:hypothetical protein